MAAEPDYDAIVVGGGVVGCAAASALAPDADVLLLEKDRIAAGATGAASGVVNIAKSLSDIPGARQALSYFRDPDSLGHAEFHERSAVQLIAGADAIHPRYRARDFSAFVDRLASEGFEVSFLDPQEVEGAYPGTYDLETYVGAVAYGDTGWVDPHSLALSLKSEAERAGTEVRTGTAVDDLVFDGGAVRGVVTSEGSIEARTVVIAAGWRTRELVSDHLDLPIRPFRYQTINLDVQPDIGDEFPIGWDTRGNLYWRPTPGGNLHVGGGTYFVNEANVHRRSVTEQFRTDVAETIPRLLRGFDEAAIASAAVCPTGDAATPDALPIIDTPPELGGTGVVATGFHGHGIMAVPIARDIVRSLVTGEPTRYSREAVELDRFERRSADFGSAYIRDPGRSMV